MVPEVWRIPGITYATPPEIDPGTLEGYGSVPRPSLSNLMANAASPSTGPTSA